MLVGSPDGEDVLLDFFVEAPGRGAAPGERAPLRPVDVPFGDVIQVFHVGPSSCGTYGMPHGICTAHQRFARLPLAELAAPAIRLAREGVAVNAQQAYIFKILQGITQWSEEGRRARSATARRARGRCSRNPELADALERLAAEGSAPFYRGDIARAVCSWIRERGGVLGAEDLAAYATIDREPVRTTYRGRDVITNPPPSAGGVLIASALAELDAEPAPPTVARLVDAMQHAQQRRTPEFLEQLALGNTTHVSVIDGDGGACSVTVVQRRVLGRDRPRHRPAPQQHDRRAGPQPARLPPPPARAPAAVDDVADARAPRRRDRAVARLGRLQPHPLGDPAADQRRRRPRARHRGGGRGSARALGGRHGVRRARRRPRRPRRPDRRPRFSERNVFFGGAQAVQRQADGTLVGAGDPRRGGAAVSVEA